MMAQLTPEFLMTLLVGALFGLGAIGQYIKTMRQTPDVISKAEQFHDRSHADQTLKALERIAVAAEKMALSVDTIADKRQSDMKETLDQIAQHMKKSP